jgi:uncharacterized membrane protein
MIENASEDTKIEDQRSEDNNDNYYKIISFHDRIKPQKSTLDKIRNDAFRTFFIIVAYYFGASYSLYPFYLLNDPIVNQSVNFIICYFVIATFSAIFGMIPGIVGSVIGDILFQIINIGFIQWQFSLVSLLLAMGGGIFKYSREHTIPKLRIMKYLYTVLITGLITGLIIGTYLEELGVSYLVSVLLSYAFAPVISILIMDRVLKFLSNENGVVYRMGLTHHFELEADHAVPIDIGGYKVFTCTRCTGTATGIIAALFIERLFFDISNIELTPEIAFIFCVVLPIPGLIDWGTQSAQLRKSNDKMRIFTGILLGMSIEFLTKTAGMDVQIAVLLLIDFTIFILLYIVKTKKLNAMDEYSFEECAIEESESQGENKNDTGGSDLTKDNNKKQY